MKITLAICLLVSAVAGRVPHTPGRPDLNELFAQADPSENEVFSESFPMRGETRNVAINPAFHIIESLSKPEYVDASEFRNIHNSDSADTLPPALDINRQLTLISASRSFQPPQFSLTATEEPLEVEEGLPLPAALFRGDISRIVNEANEDQSGREVVFDKVAEDSVAPQPHVASVLGDLTDITNSEGITEQPVPSEESSPSLSFQKRMPLTHSLSPLGHILAGFHGESGPFGSSHFRDSFITGFRPDDF